MQEQLRDATVLATCVESQMSERVREPSAQDAMVTAAAPQSWPALRITAIAVASLILMSLFSAGLLVFPGFQRLIRMVGIGLGVVLGAA